MKLLKKLTDKIHSFYLLYSRPGRVKLKPNFNAKGWWLWASMEDSELLVPYLKTALQTVTTTDIEMLFVGQVRGTDITAVQIDITYCNYSFNLVFVVKYDEQKDLASLTIEINPIMPACIIQPGFNGKPDYNAWWERHNQIVEYLHWNRTLGSTLFLLCHSDNTLESSS